MRKEMIIQRLKERGCRITKQRLLLLDIILEEDCCCCKEIYYKASKKDQNIGPATVYRMINTLEEIGAITRRSTLRSIFHRKKKKQPFEVKNYRNKYRKDRSPVLRSF